MIAIKGLEEMPSCCRHCPCSDDSQCNLTTQYNDLKGRPDDCPLVEIVTCKNCEHWDKRSTPRVPDEKEYHYCHLEDFNTAEDYYCADAERRK